MLLAYGIFSLEEVVSIGLNVEECFGVVLCCLGITFGHPLLRCRD